MVLNTNNGLKGRVWLKNPRKVNRKQNQENPVMDNPRSKKRRQEKERDRERDRESVRESLSREGNGHVVIRNSEPSK